MIFTLAKICTISIQKKIGWRFALKWQCRNRISSQFTLWSSSFYMCLPWQSTFLCFSLERHVLMTCVSMFKTFFWIHLQIWRKFAKQIPKLHQTLSTCWRKNGHFKYYVLGCNLCLIRNLLKVYFFFSKIKIYCTFFVNLVLESNKNKEICTHFKYLCF